MHASQPALGFPSSILPQPLDVALARSLIYLHLLRIQVSNSCGPEVLHPRKKINQAVPRLQQLGTTHLHTRVTSQLHGGIFPAPWQQPVLQH